LPGKHSIFAAFAALVFALSLPVFAYGEALVLTGVQNDVTIMDQNGRERKAQLNMQVQVGETIRTGAVSIAVMKTPGGDEISVHELTRLTVERHHITEQGAVKQAYRLESGKVLAQIQKLGVNYEFEVRTPVALAGVRGTIIGVEQRGQRYVFRCYEGTMVVEQGGRQIEVGPMQEVTISPEGVTQPSPISDTELKQAYRDASRIAVASGESSFTERTRAAIQKEAQKRGIDLKEVEKEEKPGKKTEAGETGEEGSGKSRGDEQKAKKVKVVSAEEAGDEGMTVMEIVEQIDRVGFVETEILSDLNIIDNLIEEPVTTETSEAGNSGQ